MQEIYNYAENSLEKIAIKKFNVKVYSPNTNIVFTTDLIDQKKRI